MKNKKYNMTDLNNVMESLLAENGCPWDKVQTHETLKNYLIEESYEVVEAIDNKDSENLCEELGDVLFQIIFHSKLAERKNKFDFSDVVNNVTAKMIYRHPHVFADESADTPQDVSKSWEVLKKKEKGYNTKKDVLESIPNALPALIKGDKTVSKATKLGLENINLTDSINNLEIELQKIKENNISEKTENEEIIGNCFLELIRISKFFKQNSEIALTNAIKTYINNLEGVDEQF